MRAIDERLEPLAGEFGAATDVVRVLLLVSPT